VAIAPDNLPDDAAALKRIIAAMAQDALTAQAEIARNSNWPAIAEPSSAVPGRS
jgi:hypothetical protein